MVNSIKPVLLINPNTNTATTDLMVQTFAAALGQADPALAGFPVVGITASSGPAMITNEDELAAAAAATVSAYRSWHEDHGLPAAIVVAAFGDPGLDVLSRQPVPVLGIGSHTVLEVARRVRAGGHRFGIATTTPGLRQSLEYLCSRELDVLAGIEFTGTAPTVLAASPQDQDDELAEAVSRLVAAGATEVIIGGGPLTGSAARLVDVVPTQERFVTRAGTRVDIIVPLQEVARSLAPLLTP
ncbi:aspartate/glutamate racemase family protein [Micrococcoides hystricis]|uniref:Aspartate/glutamate racemase family protein n=1 Tax=Micrococcoides hystricis TaxID=1572761 RepID=A0ABV6PBB3_9MICC